MLVLERLQINSNRSICFAMGQVLLARVGLFSRADPDYPQWSWWRDPSDRIVGKRRIAIAIRRAPITQTLNGSQASSASVVRSLCMIPTEDTV